LFFIGTNPDNLDHLKTEENLMRSKVYVQYRILHLMVIVALAFAALPPVTPVQAAGSPDIVISQVYGGGAGGGATYKYDFIELYNRGTAAVSINGWSVQYAAKTGTNWNKTNLGDVSIPAGGYYLIQEGGTTAAGADLPTPDLTGSIAMSGSGGKVVLLNVNTVITAGTACPSGASVVDIVGYGSTTTCSETAPTADLSVTTAALRKANGATDTDNNSADFTITTPNPRNAAAVSVTNPSGVGTATPGSASGGDTVLLTVAVTPGTNPVSSGLAVTVDLSAIGGSATQTFYDDGSNGDVTPGNNTFSFRATIAAGTTGGVKSLLAKITDAETRSGNTNIVLTIIGTSSPSGSGTATPASALVGGSTLLKVVVTPGTLPASTGLAVSADLSTINGSATQTFYDNGTNGDVTPGDNTFSFLATVAVGTTTGAKSLPVAISDAQSRKGSTSIAFTVNAAAAGCGSAATYIHTIQGSATASSMTGSAVTIEGIVVGDYQSTSFGGFYVQEEDSDATSENNPATSEGIYVYSAATAVSSGDKVRVTGTIAEYGTAPTTLTQLGPVTNITVCASGQTLPTAATLNLPVANISDMEAFEGMLVHIPQELTVVNNYSLGRYGEVGLAQGGNVYQFTHLNPPSVSGNAAYQATVAKRIITLDDGSSTQNLDPILYPAPGGLTASNTLRLGYTLPGGLTGVLDQRNATYKIQPVGPINFTASNPRSATPPVVNGTLRVAFMNLLNYFNGDGSGGGFPTARGASTTAEFTRQRNKTIPAVHGVNAAVIGVMEVENDYDLGTKSAMYDLVSGLNALAGAGTYAYIDPGAKVGSDQIAVGVIYKPSLVTPVGAFKTLTTGAFSANNRVPIAQTFQQISTGEKFTVVVNHFKSKGSACSTSPDLSDGQGNCNLVRVAASQDLAAWLAKDPTGSGDPDFVIMGDLNAYAKEDPITTLEGLGYINLLSKFSGNAAYSYQFSGQLGYLDHLLGSASLTHQTEGAAEWHINSVEPIILSYNTEFKSTGQLTSLYAADPYYAADHDPAVIGLNLATDESDLPASYGVARHSRSHTYLGSKFADGFSAVGTVSNTATSTNDGVRPTTGVRWTTSGGGSVDVTVNSLSGGYVSGWIDWNNDGDFGDTGEAILGNEAFGAGTVTRTIPFAIPAGTPIATFNARFRVYDQAQLPDVLPDSLEPIINALAQPANSVIGGEVEDYTWNNSATAVELLGFGGRSIAAVPWLGLILCLGLMGLRLVFWRRISRRA
jgi:predicted extracellular nuclease